MDGTEQLPEIVEVGKPTTSWKFQKLSSEAATVSMEDPLVKDRWYVAVFTGPESPNRAEDYANWMNRK